jgi:hypothetical protein
MQRMLKRLLIGIGIVSIVPHFSAAQWVQTGGLSGGWISALSSCGNTIFAGTDAWNCIYGMFRSSDNGAHWSVVDSGLPTSCFCLTFAISGKYMYAGTSGNGTLFAGTVENGVWRRPLSQMAAVVDRHANNQSTLNLDIRIKNIAGNKIVCSLFLPSAGMVVGKIYNVSGHQVATVIGNRLEAGTHALLWDMNHLPSGCYALRIQTKSGTITKAISIV